MTHVYVFSSRKTNDDLHFTLEPSVFLPEQNTKHLTEEDCHRDSVADAAPMLCNKREMAKALSKELCGFELADLIIQGISPQIDKEEQQFLYDSLIYPVQLLLGLCSWLKYTYFALEAKQNSQPAKPYLEKALAALEAIYAFSPQYCHEKWENWYFDCRKLNLNEALKATRQAWNEEK